MSYNSNFSFSSSAGGPGTVLVGGISYGNRSRLDSGMSGSSEGSKGSGKPPRRRSHRPRGCRGGSNRRRNNSSDCSKKNNKGNESKAKPGNKTVLSKYPKQTIQDAKNLPLQDFTSLSRQSQQNSAYFADRTPGMLNRESRNYCAMSISTAPLTDYSSSLGGYENQSIANAFSIIQTSFSDSSLEFVDPSLQGNVPFSAEYDNNSTSSRSNNSKILPPLPSNIFNNESIPLGPNPYALKLTSHDHNNMFHTQENLPHILTPSDMTATTNKFMGGYATPMKNVMPPQGNHYPLQCFSNIDNRSTHSNMGPPPPRPKLPFGIQNPKLTVGSIIPVAKCSENDYRAERLQIQRQTVEGGSLFVTSPRSFLMGKRNGTAGTAFAF